MKARNPAQALNGWITAAKIDRAYSTIHKFAVAQPYQSCALCRYCGLPDFKFAAAKIVTETDRGHHWNTRFLCRSCFDLVNDGCGGRLKIVLPDVATKSAQLTIERPPLEPISEDDEKDQTLQIVKRFGTGTSATLTSRCRKEGILPPASLTQFLTVLAQEGKIYRDRAKKSHHYIYSSKPIKAANLAKKRFTNKDRVMQMVEESGGGLLASDIKELDPDLPQRSFSCTLSGLVQEGRLLTTGHFHARRYYTQEQWADLVVRLQKALDELIAADQPFTLSELVLRANAPNEALELRPKLKKRAQKAIEQLCDRELERSERSNAA